MARPGSPERGLSYAALCSGIYAAFGGAWITVSDRIATALIPEGVQLSVFQTYKGWLFVAGSALLIYLLLRRAERRAARLDAAFNPAPAAGPSPPGIPLVGQLVLLVLGVAAPLCGLLGWSIYHNAEQEISSSKRLVADLTRITARDAAKFISDTSQTMGSVAQRPLVRAMDPAHCDPVLADVPVLNARFVNAAIFDLSGRLVCSVLPLPPGAALVFPLSAEQQRVLHEERFVLSRPFFGSISGRAIVVASRPISDAAGRIVGSLNFSISLEALRPVVRPVLPPSGVVGIINTDGAIIYGESRDRRGKDGRDTEIVRVAIAQKSGEAMARGYDGQLRSYYFVPIEGTDWIAIAGLPTNLIYGEARDSAWRGGLIGLAIILLAAIGGAWMSRRIARPILGIAEAARRVAEGDLRVRAPEGGSPESRAVAQQFNRMLDRLPLMEDEIRESERRYKSLFETSPECVFVHEDGVIVMINPAGARLYGASSTGQMVGMQVADLAHPDDRAQVEQRLHDVSVLRQEVAPRELKNRRLDGTPIMIEVSSRPFEYRGRPAVLTQLRDITARKAAEAQVIRLAHLYAMLSRTNEAIVRESGREGLCRAVCRIIVEQGGFITAGIRLYDATRDAYVPVASHGPVSDWVCERTVAVDDMRSRMVWALKDNRTYVLNDVNNHPDKAAGGDDMRRLGICSMAVLPLIMDGQGVGALSVFSDEPGYFDAQMVALLEEMVRNLSFAFTKLKNENALQESELRYRMLVEVSPDAVAVLVDERVALVNPAALRLYGASGPEQMIGRNGYDFSHPDQHDEARRDIGEVMSLDGRVSHAETRHVRLDGSVFDAEVVRSRFDYHGKAALQVIVRDISERKEAERRIARLTHLFSALSKTNEAIARATDSQALCATVCRVAVDHGHFTTAFIGMLSQDRQIVRPVGAYGRVAGVIGEQPILLAAGERATDGPLASALREGQVMVSNNVFDDPRTLLTQDDAQRARIHAVAACPLSVDGVVVGALTVYGDAVDFFDSEMIDLLKEMAQNLSFGLTKLQSDAAHLASEAALRDSELRYRRLFDTTPVCIYVRQDDEVVLINPAGVKLFGAQSADQIIGRPVTDLVHPDYHELMHQRFVTVTGEGSAAPLREFKNVRLDGSVIETESIVTPFEFQGRPAVQVIVADISVRKDAERAMLRLNAELEQRVQQRTKELQRVNQELSEFSYIVSHDLKAPLRGVASLVGWLEQDHGEAMSPEGRELLRLLSTRSRRMHRLIEDILHFSRLGRTRENAIELNLSRLVHEVVDSLAPPDHIDVHVAPLPRVVGDETRMKQVFQNLISNAIKFMDKPHGLIEVGVQEAPDLDDAWVFFVADNGPGIEARHHQRIFDIFQTLHPRDDPESTGIGLTVVKKIIELRGGRIWVESDAGKGARFVFTLPRKDIAINDGRAGWGDVYERPDADTAG